MKRLQYALLVVLRWVSYNVGFGFRRGWEAAAPVFAPRIK